MPGTTGNYSGIHYNKVLDSKSSVHMMGRRTFVDYTCFNVGELGHICGDSQQMYVFKFGQQPF